MFAQDSTKATSLNKVIVTGQYSPQSLKKSVYQVRVISNEKIRLSGATNVQQALNTELGFRFPTDNTLGVTDVQLNGMSGRNVKILLDGVPMLDRFDERTSLSQIDVNTIDHIEIVEGPMSVSYGTDAMAGVINVITKKNYRNGLTLNAKAQEESAGDEYHAFNYKGVHTQSGNADYKKDNWNFSAGGAHNEFDGFGGDNYGRGKSWLPKEQWFGNGKIGYSKNKFSIYYRLDAMKENIIDRNKLNIDLDPGSPIARAVDQRYRSDRFMHQVQGNYAFSNKLSLSSVMAYSDFKRATVTNDVDLVGHTDTLSDLAGAQDISRLKSFSFKNTVQYIISDKLSLQPGLDINYEKASGQRIIGAPSINDYAVFVSAEYKPVAAVSIRPGLRFESNSKYDAPPAIPSVNTKFILNKNLDLRLSYGYGFRAPVLRELYFDFHDVNHNITGNPDLKAETSNSFNGSLTWAAPQTHDMNFTSTLGAFYNSFKNQINLAEIKNAPPSPQIPYSYVNIDKVRTAGFSISNNFSGKHFDANLGFNYIGFDQTFDPSFVKSDSRDYLWTPEVNAGFIYKLNKIKTSLALFYKYSGQKPSFSEGITGSGQSAVNLTHTDAYNFADFSATTSILKYITISAGVKNIFDVTDVNSNAVVSSSSAHSTAGNISVNYGRSYFVGLAFQLHKK